MGQPAEKKIIEERNNAFKKMGAELNGITGVKKRWGQALFNQTVKDVNELGFTQEATDIMNACAEALKKL